MNAIAAESKTVDATPILKWPGGKARVLKHILPLLPETFGNYHEPFLGGGALFFKLASTGQITRKAFLSDVNKRLIRTYKFVRDDVESVIAALQRCVHTPEFYYAKRAEFNAEQGSQESLAAAMIYLNKSCFNGLYRENKKGDFNASWGKYPTPKYLNFEDYRAASVAFQGVEIDLCGFEKTAERAEPGDLVYFDPPYVPASESADFTEYSAEGFGPEKQTELRDLFVELGKRGVHVIASNSDTEFVRKLYDGFEITPIRVARVINVHTDKRGQVGEVLIRNRVG